MIRGTRVTFGEEARAYTDLVDTFRSCLIDSGYEEMIIPSLWEQKVFVEKAGKEVLGQMYAFGDKKNRPICLIPEVTAVIQEIWNGGMSKAVKKPCRLFYVNRCYRYEKPQRGRQREFLQIGAEILGGTKLEYREEAIDTLTKCLDQVPNIKYRVEPMVKRGLDYYTEDGFEAICDDLGAQKQIAGGGRYECGVGWAVGVERLLFASGQWK